MIKNPSKLIVREAYEEDRQNLANLIHFGTYVHRHLDWRTPLDWVGNEPYVIAQERDELIAALACPPDPPNIAWIRLFAVYNNDMAAELWEMLWELARSQLAQFSGLLTVAAMPLHGWFRNLLEKSDFTSPHKVVVLSWSRDHHASNKKADNWNFIRPMVYDDLAEVEKIDQAAFGGVWQNSQSCLEIAFRQSAVATVADAEGIIVGYQISTATQMGGHLARLAVHPAYQGRGIGYALVRDMLSQFERRGAHHVTVNTQHDNLVSLSLYQKAGFKRTGEEYPLYEYDLS